MSRSTEIEGATPITDSQELSKKEKKSLYEAYDFYAKDVYPRKQKYNGSYNPEIHNMDNLTKRVIFREPLSLKKGFWTGGYAPIYLPSESSQIPNFLTPIVTRKPRDFGNTVLHEATHAEDGDSFKTDNFKLGESMTDEEMRLLDNAYKFEYEDDMARAEKQTTNREFRFGLSRLTGLYLDDLTDYINNLSTKELKKLYKKISPGYRELMIKPKYDDNWRDAVKKALIQVGQNTTDQNRIDYRDPITFVKKGGRIHIKKKNRGKFTEYCGGKVTQECIRKGKNSPNPLTRKRAAFAGASRTWKHKNGGILKYQNPAITLDMPEGSEYGGELEPAVVKPAPLYGVLNTYYPVISEFPLTGHSELQIVDFGWDKPLTISKYGTDYDYNLVTNNCSDATRCAVEKIFGEKINPVLFTTPGDVQDFVAEKTGQKPVKEGVGKTSLGFNIPFATAMDLKNQNLDFYIQDYLHKAAKMKKQMKEENPNWNSDSFDLSTAEVIQHYKDQKYKFQPFKDKNGGILKAQEGAVNLLTTPHPLSPIGVAVNQAKAMAKTKGEQQPQQPQQNLPPGVKEVVGPDGKKVTIRTEQPLVPLEQSIAEWLPGTGDVAEVGYIANDVKNGNYGTAALATAMVALPGNIGKIFRKSDIPTSKLTEAERLGIPKGERNQPAKAPTKNQTYKKTINLVTDKEYTDDVVAIQNGILGKMNLDSEHQALLEWFNSPQYRERLVKQGFNEEQINNLLSTVSDRLSSKNLRYAENLNSIRNWGLKPGMILDIDPQLQPAYEAMTNTGIKFGEHPVKWSLIQLKKDADLDEVIPHEVGGHHTESLLSEFNTPYTSQQVTDIGKKAATSSGLSEGYYPSWQETRARALTIAKQMREAGWNPNSPEQVNVWLNKHLLKDRNTNVVQGALYYDRPGFVKAVSEGLKNGGKL